MKHFHYMNQETFFLCRAGNSCLAYDKIGRKLSLTIANHPVIQCLRIPQPIKATTTFIRRLKRFFSPFPLYFWFSSTDCDQMHVEYAVRYPNGWTATRCMYDAIDNAEGPLGFQQLTKKEYLQCMKESVRDDIAARNAGY